MKALVYHGPGQRGWDSVTTRRSSIRPTSSSGSTPRRSAAPTCTSSRATSPRRRPGTVLGHEAVGTVLEIGAAVTTVAVGDRVLLSCISSCGRCRFCKEGHYGQCLGGGGWIFGHTIDGLQAEYARVPFADNSVYKVPDELSDEQVLFLADILPTAYEVGVLNGMVAPGDVVAIVGAGPIGLAAILTAKLYTPGRIMAIDLDDTRLESALGSAPTRRSTTVGRTRWRGSWSSRAASAPTSRSRRSACRRRSSWHRADPTRRARREHRRARQAA